MLIRQSAEIGVICGLLGKWAKVLEQLDSRKTIEQEIAEATEKNPLFSLLPHGFSQNTLVARYLLGN